MQTIVCSFIAHYPRLKEYFPVDTMLFADSYHVVSLVIKEFVERYTIILQITGNHLYFYLQS